MLKIDAHQHFWVYDEIRDSWISEEMAVLRKDYLPGDLLPVLQQHQFDGCIVVQSDQSNAENRFQLANADAYDFIKGVVCWVDLQAADIKDQLAAWRSFKKLKGFRHILQGEADRALMLKPAFLNGIQALKAFDYTYDILIFPDQLKFATALAARFPDQKFVLDHIAKPDIKNQKIADWQQDIQALAALENVSCKVSGMVTEAHWSDWKSGDFKAYMDVVFEAFGPKRVMYGSDWPVCLLAGSYGAVLNLVDDYTKALSANERDLFWGGNATNFYNLI